MHCARRTWPTTSLWLAMERKRWIFYSVLDPMPGRSFDHPPKLVLLNMKMPKVDGMQVLKQIKGDARTRTIPVVLMTSSREERDMVSGYDLGINSYLQKPVDFDEFRKMVKLLGLYWLVINQPPVTNGKPHVAGQTQ